jgi:hypothetical protein
VIPDSRPQVELKSLGPTAQKPNLRIVCTIWCPKLKINVLLLKIEILGKNPERSPNNGGLYFSEEQDPALKGEEETILLGRSDFSSTCGATGHSPQVEIRVKSLPHKNQICGSSVSVLKLKINVLLLKIEILGKNPERLNKTAACGGE